MFLIRHGEVVPPAPGAFYGGTEVELSPRGRQEAASAARDLAHEDLDAVYSSPLSRARFGAEQILLGRLGLDLQVADGVREIDRGRWVGLTPEEVERRWPGDLEAHRRDPEAWRAHGGESLGGLRDRCLRVRDWLLEQYPEGSIALVSHLFPTRAILAASLGLPLDQWGTLRLPTGSISLVDYRQAGSEVRWTGRRS
ncbi:MAG: histidine phosphatase family protein [Planctomycetes bacterium]|nr:histidine phosphatase family protein [Planctomycetota bacterium]MBL7007584.1 histidine phosphatase family protein [Planctomycetota bacterium]